MTTSAYTSIYRSREAQQAAAEAAAADRVAMESAINAAFEAAKPILDAAWFDKLPRERATDLIYAVVVRTVKTLGNAA